MTLFLGIGAAIILVGVAFFLWSKKSRPAPPNTAVPQQAAPKKAKKRTSDTQAFRAWAAGDIDHDKYNEILDKNAKDRT